MTIFITGPGRSGTSFLMQLLTRLGMDTGFEPYNERYSDVIRAGCELSLSFFHELEGAPKYIKGPTWAYYLKYMVVNQRADVEHVVMPLRDLTESAISRLDAGLQFMMDKEYVQLPGEHVVEVQENILAMLTGKVLEACYLYEIPLTLMSFPRLVQDEQYCYDKMSEFAEVDRETFGDKWKELVHG